MSTSEGANAIAKPPPPCRAPSYNPSIQGILFSRIQRRFAVPLAELKAENYPYDVALDSKGCNIPFDEYHARVPPPADFGYPGDIWIVTAPGALALYARVVDHWTRWAGPLEGTITNPLLRKRVFWLGKTGGTWLLSSTHVQYCWKFKLRIRQGHFDGSPSQSAAEASITELLEHEHQRFGLWTGHNTEAEGSAGTDIVAKPGHSLLAEADSGTRRSFTSPKSQAVDIDDDAQASHMQLSTRTPTSGTSEAPMDVDAEEDLSLENDPVYDEDKTEVEVPLRQLYNAALGLGPNDPLDQEFIEVAQPMMRGVISAIAQLYASYQKEKMARIASEEQFNRVREFLNAPRNEWGKSTTQAAASSHDVEESPSLNSSSTSERKLLKVKSATRRFSLPNAGTAKRPLIDSLDVAPINPSASTARNGATADVRKRRRTSGLHLQASDSESNTRAGATALLTPPASASGSSSNGGGLAEIPPAAHHNLYCRILYRIVRNRLECRACLNRQLYDMSVAAVSFVADAPATVWYRHCVDVHGRACSALAAKSEQELEEILVSVEADEGNGEDEDETELEDGGDIPCV